MEQFDKRRLHAASLLTAGLFIVSLASTVLAQSKPSKWERSIKAFEAVDKKKKPQLGSLLFIGSSSIRR